MAPVLFLADLMYVKLCSRYFTCILLFNSPSHHVRKININSRKLKHRGIKSPVQDHIIGAEPDLKSGRLAPGLTVLTCIFYHLPSYRCQRSHSRWPRWWQWWGTSSFMSNDDTLMIILTALSHYYVPGNILRVWGASRNKTDRFLDMSHFILPTLHFSQRNGWCLSRI